MIDNFQEQHPLEKEEEVVDDSEVLTAQLQPITKEEQATTTLDAQPPTDEPPVEEVKEAEPVSEKDPNKSGGFYPGSNYLFGNLENTIQALSTAGLGAADFVFDAAGTVIPGMNAVDNQWDKMTRLPNETHQAFRKFASIVIPSIVAGGGVAQTVQSQAIAQLPRLQKALVAAGLFSAADAAVIGLSDIGEEDNMLTVVANTFPGIFGPKGIVPIPEAVKTHPGDSTSTRKWLNMLDTAGLSILGSLLGFALKFRSGTKKMGWFQPKDDVAAAYKANEVMKGADPEKLTRMQEINEVLATGSLSKVQEENLINEYLNLENSLESVDNLEDALRQVEESKINEQNIAAIRKLDADPNASGFDRDITPITDEASNARPRVEPGIVAKNMADTTAIKNGTSTGDPAPIITESMRNKGLMDSPRGAVMGVAEEGRDIGRFDAVVDGFRYSNKQMNAAAWDIYTSIVDPGASLDDVKALFYEDRDVANLLMGRFKVEYINEDQARAAAFGMRDLTDRFIGGDVTRTSARVMDTLGREAATIAEAVQELSPAVDENRAMDLIIDKLQFLMDEYGLNKYISGWRLRNKNWFDQTPPGQLDEAIEGLTQEFRAAEQSIHNKNVGFTKELLRLADENPLAMRPLVDAFAHTNGDVDSLAKLMKWAANQVTPTGMLKSPDPKELNLFTRSAWGVVYNNVLSGISALRAVVGNTSQLMLRPITGALGHTLWGYTDGFEGLKRTMYYHGSVFETNRRALKDAYTMMKKAHKDPEVMMQSYRKDFIFKEDTTWDILEDMRAVWEKEGNRGRIIQYDMATTMRDLSKLPGLRYGMTGMVFTDVFTNTHIAHYLSRMRAYDDVFFEFGFADWNKIVQAEKKHYKTMFTADGLIKDEALKSLSGEIALNLDDGLATWINQATTSYPITKHLFMFPRTGSNYVKNALSWTPISAIPGINKYSKTIWAQTDDDIAKALAEHGIDMATTPNAKVLFENLRAEYTGRIAFSSLLTKVLWDYAMGGNIRGNGRRRFKERDQFGYEPKTLQLGGRWISFKGIPGVDPVLSILGDLSYYAGDIDQALMEDWHAKVMWTISATFLNETPLQGLEPLVAIGNGDLTGFNRFIAQSTMSFFPMVGGISVLNNAISSSQKSISGEIHEYMMNKIPFASDLLAKRIDVWTGGEINDINSPWLKALNAFLPNKVSEPIEDWRKWLNETGYKGLSKLNYDSTGTYKYTEKEKEWILRKMGEAQMYKKVIKWMKSKKFNKELGTLRAHRATGQDLENPNIELDTQKLPVNQFLDRLVRDTQKWAEQQFLLEASDNPEFTNLARVIRMQDLAEGAMKKGDVNRAREIQKKELETRQLLQMSK